MTIRELNPDDAAGLAGFLGSQPPSYREHFRPFADESGEALAAVLRGKSRDAYWGVFSSESSEEWLACFMLRGWDEGYERPAFGVIVDHRRGGCGLGRLCLSVALVHCRLNRVPSCMLKVSPNNPTASRLYEREGFEFESVCPATGHHILAIELSRP